MGAGQSDKMECIQDFPMHVCSGCGTHYGPYHHARPSPIDVDARVLECVEGVTATRITS